MSNISKEEVLSILQGVKDPEVPVVSVVELGLIRDVLWENDNLRIDLAPTYSGCPALKRIEDDVKAALHKAGLTQVTIRQVYAPPWTTEWISEIGKQKLKKYGIAPPQKVDEDQLVPFPKVKINIPCPFCDSKQTHKTSEFGPTACKALYFCEACTQPFEYFKAF